MPALRPGAREAPIDGPVAAGGYRDLMISLSILTVITALAAVFALLDGIARLRSSRNSTVLAVVELVLAVLMILTFFVALPAPLSLIILSIALEAVLVLSLVTGGRGARPTMTIVALVLNTIVLLVAFGWVAIPGLF